LRTQGNVRCRCSCRSILPLDLVGNNVISARTVSVLRCRTASLVRLVVSDLFEAVPHLGSLYIPNTKGAA
jgi:hypothetical protein